MKILKVFKILFSTLYIQTLILVPQVSFIYSLPIPFEGDIVANLAQIEEAYNVYSIDGLINERKYLWKNRNKKDQVVIPYTLKENAFTEYHVNIIKTALDDLTNQTKYIKFKQYGSNNKNKKPPKSHIEFKSDRGGCWAHLGKYNIKQYINLATGCVRHGIVQHEMIHALGVWHEQSRPDRDDYINILWDNIQSGGEKNFMKRGGIDSLGIPYDYGSVMHYAKDAFSNGKGDTIDSHGNPIGQIDGVSPNDVLQLQLLYKCPKPRNISSFCTPNCKCNEMEGMCYRDKDCNVFLKCDRNICVKDCDRLCKKQKSSKKCNEVDGCLCEWKRKKCYYTQYESQHYLFANSPPS